MPATTPSPDRVRVDGKFFRLGGQKFYARGVTYGPFAPSEDKSNFSSRAQVERDFRQLRELNANTLRVYTVPPRWREKSRISSSVSTALPGKTSST